MNRANGPSRRHSPFSAPGREAGSLEFEAAVAVAVADEIMNDMAVVWAIAVGWIWRGVGGRSIVARGTFVGRECAADSVEATCCSDIRIKRGPITDHRMACGARGTNSGEHFGLCEAWIVSRVL